MITCDCVVDSKKKPEISYPTQFEHTIHVGFDPVTSEFTVSRLSYSFKEEFCVLVERPSSKIDLSDQLSIPGFLYLLQSIVFKLMSISPEITNGP